VSTAGSDSGRVVWAEGGCAASAALGAASDVAEAVDSAA
jgi:hypothetical protein